jgi:amidase
LSGFPEYHQYDGLGLAELVKKGKVKPIELIEEAITRIEKLNPKLNAVIHKMYDQAREKSQADLPDGSFMGVPFLLKDLLAAYAGVPLSNGSRFNKDFIPDHDSELVKRYKAAGVVVVGKTNTPEYGLLPVTEPELFGPTFNPWDLSRTPGGSSGGAAAAVSSRIVPLAHGSDGGGSIRMPASCCGLFGLKPTRGRNPLGPDFGEAWQGFACEHVLSRSVRDSAVMLDATAGPDVGAPYAAPPPSRPFLDEVGQNPGRLRIAFTHKPFLADSVHEDCIRGLEETIQLCKDLDHDLTEAAPQIDREMFAKAFMTIVCAETRAGIEKSEFLMGRKARYRDFEPSTWMLGLLGKQLRAPQLSNAKFTLQYMSRLVSHFFEKFDILLTPTLALPPIKIGALQPNKKDAFLMKFLGRLNAGALLMAVKGIEDLAQKAYTFMPYTPLFNVTGQPAMSVPLYWNEEGLPIGMQFVGRYADEATLFRLAGQLEKAKPWSNRIPPICSENKS